MLKNFLGQNHKVIWGCYFIGAVARFFCQIVNTQMIWVWVLTLWAKSHLLKVLQDFSKIRTLDLFKMRAVFMVLIKGGSVQETLFHEFSAYSKFEFSFELSICVCLFKKWPSQFLSH